MPPTSQWILGKLCILPMLGIFWIMNEGVGGVCSKAHWHSQIAACATEYASIVAALSRYGHGSEANARKTTGADGAVALFTDLLHSPTLLLLQAVNPPRKSSLLQLNRNYLKNRNSPEQTFPELNFKGRLSIFSRVSLPSDIVHIKITIKCLNMFYNTETKTQNEW